MYSELKIPLVGREMEKYILGLTASDASDEPRYASVYLGTCKLKVVTSHQGQ